MITSDPIKFSLSIQIEFEKPLNGDKTPCFFDSNMENVSSNLDSDQYYQSPSFDANQYFFARLRADGSLRDFN